LRLRQAEVFENDSSDSHVYQSAYNLSHVNSRIAKLESISQRSAEEEAQLSDLLESKKVIVKSFETNFNSVAMGSRAKARFLQLGTFNLPEISKNIDNAFSEDTMNQVAAGVARVPDPDEQSLEIMCSEITNRLRTLSLPRVYSEKNLAKDSLENSLYNDKVRRMDIQISDRLAVALQTQFDADQRKPDHEALLLQYYENYNFLENRLREFWEKGLPEAREKLSRASERAIIPSTVEEIDAVIGSLRPFLYNPVDNKIDSQDGQFLKATEGSVGIMWSSLIDYDFFVHAMQHEVIHGLSGATTSLENDQGKQIIRHHRMGMNFFVPNIDQDVGYGLWLNEGYTEYLNVLVGGRDYGVYVNFRQSVQKLFQLGLRENILQRAYFEKFDPGNQERTPHWKEFSGQIRKKFGVRLADFMRSAEVLPANRREPILERLRKRITKKRKVT
jgi:hypothetical protein